MAQVNIPDALLAEVAARHPFPWTHVVNPNGLVQVGDAKRMEVDLFLQIKVAAAVGEGLTT